MKKETKIKYLLLMEPEEEFPEQINSYMFLVMEIILLAKKLGRVFVLPYLHSQPRNNNLAEHANDLDTHRFVLGKRLDPMEKYFNVSKLPEYVKTISFKDFLKISKKNLSYLGCYGQKYSDSIKVYGEKFTFKRSEMLTNVDQLLTINEQFLGVAGYHRHNSLIKKSPKWPPELQNDYWEIRSRLLPNKQLVNKADQFIKNKLPDEFLAVHWRRGDRANRLASYEIGEMMEKTASEDEEMKKWLDYYLINPMKKLMKEYNLEKIFLATNSGTQWHLQYLKSNLPIVQYPYSSSWKDREFESIIEQIICAKSDHFFSGPHRYNQCSGFSRWIIDSRIIAGKGDTVSYQKKMGSEVPLLIKIKKCFFSKTRPVTTITDQQLIETLSQKLSSCQTPILYDIGTGARNLTLLKKLHPKMKVFTFEQNVNLDDVIQQHPLPNPTHLKINSEGNELTLLEKGEKLINCAKPIILLQRNSQILYQEKIVKLLTNWKFTISPLSGNTILCRPH